MTVLSLAEKLKWMELPLRRYVLPDRFYRVEIETVSSCNRKCGYCPVAYDPRPGHRMPEPLFLSIIDQLAEMRFRGRFSPHFFGEPLVDKRLPRLVAEVKKRLPKVQVVIYTNGDLLDYAAAEALIEAGVGLFIVTYEDEEPPAMADLRARMAPARLRLHVSPRQFRRDVKAPYNRAGTVLFPGSELHHSACVSPATTLVVDAWGRVKLCPNDYYGREDWGDLDTERLADIWRRPDFVALRRALMAGRFEKKTCRECAGIDPPSAPLATYR